MLKYNQKFIRIFYPFFSFSEQILWLKSVKKQNQWAQRFFFFCWLLLISVCAAFGWKHVSLREGEKLTGWERERERERERGCGRDGQKQKLEKLIGGEVNSRLMCSPALSWVYVREKGKLFARQHCLLPWLPLPCILHSLHSPLSLTPYIALLNPNQPCHNCSRDSETLLHLMCFNEPQHNKVEDKTTTNTHEYTQPHLHAHTTSHTVITRADWCAS